MHSLKNNHQEQSFSFEITKIIFLQNSGVDHTMKPELDLEIKGSGLKPH